MTSGAGEPSETELAAIAEALYRYDAPRYGNDIRPYEELGTMEKRKFVALAEIAVRKWQSLQTS